MEYVKRGENHRDKLKRWLDAGARLVYDGKIFRLYEQPVIFKNPETGKEETQIYELVERRDAAHVLAEKDGKIWMALQVQFGYPKPFYAPFGGFVDNKEKPDVAALREMLEEGGFESDEIFPIGELSPQNSMAWTEYYFYAKNCRKVANQKLDAAEQQMTLIAMPPKKFMKEMLFNPNFRAADDLKHLLLSQPAAADVARFIGMFDRTKS